jgi:hypothetical protein
MRYAIRTVTLFFILLTGSLPHLSAQISLDRVTDTVRCREDPAQSYALYVPAKYHDKMSWPVILIFDPAAGGKRGVSVFLDAGRKYGFILACSNNSRNGPLADNLAAAKSMFRDVTGKFNIDQRRIYASGFSGGSRFAMSFAMTESRVSGVIGCGAGFPGNNFSLPPENSGFLYYGIAGNRDMNYPEMFQLSDFLNSRPGFISYFRTFAGGHQWPPSELITAAVEWVILQEMNTKALPADQSFISVIEKKTENLISSSMAEGNYIDAVRYMKSAVQDFKGTPFETRMDRLLADTEKSPKYSAAVRKWTRTVSNEQETEEKYMNYLNEVLISGSIPDSASGWWKRETASLTRLRDKGTPEKSQMASRILNFISIGCSVQGTSLYTSSSFPQAAFLFEICTWSDNENPENYYNLARSFAMAGKTKKSVDVLAAVIDHGFPLRKKVLSDNAFNSIRADDRYKALMNKMR